MRQPTTSTMMILACISCLASAGCKNRTQVERDTKLLERKIDDLYTEINSVTQARELSDKDAKDREKEGDAFITMWREHQKRVGKPSSPGVAVDEAVVQSQAELDALTTEEQRVQKLIRQIEADSQAYSAKYSKPQ